MTIPLSSLRKPLTPENRILAEQALGDGMLNWCERNGPELNALMGAVRAALWAPIQTAPLDGTRVDLWANDQRYADCFFHPAWGCWARKEGFPVVTRTLINLKPTHWAAIPAAPGG